MWRKRLLDRSLPEYNYTLLLYVQLSCMYVQLLFVRLYACKLLFPSRPWFAPRKQPTRETPGVNSLHSPPHAAVPVTHLASRSRPDSQSRRATRPPSIASPSILPLAGHVTAVLKPHTSFPRGIPSRGVANWEVKQPIHSRVLPHRCAGTAAQPPSGRHRHRKTPH